MFWPWASFEEWDGPHAEHLTSSSGLAVLPAPLSLFPFICFCPGTARLQSLQCPAEGALAAAQTEGPVGPEGSTENLPFSFPRKKRCRRGYGFRGEPPGSAAYKGWKLVLFRSGLNLGAHLTLSVCFGGNNKRILREVFRKLKKQSHLPLKSSS